MTRVAILSPGYPGTPGGVTDHTARLVKSWSALGADVRVLGETAPPIAPTIANLDAERTEAVLIQYVPFLYGRRGLSKLPEAIANGCRRLGIGVTTFVHEPWVPPNRLPWLALSPLQRRQLRRLMSRCGSVVTAVPTWARLLGRRTRTLYVGSTLGDLPQDCEFEPTLPAPVVFSPFASGLRWDWITAAVQAIGKDLVIIGSDREAALSNPHVSRYMDKDWEYAGRLASEEALRLLARARLVLAPFIDGITGRRTSAMAALSAGARVVTRRGHLHDPHFDDCISGSALSKAEFARLAVSTWTSEDSASDRAKRISWYDEQLSPTALDTELLNVVLENRSL